MRLPACSAAWSGIWIFWSSTPNFVMWNFLMMSRILSGQQICADQLLYCRQWGRNQNSFFRGGITGIYHPTGTQQKTGCESVVLRERSGKICAGRGRDPGGESSEACKGRRTGADRRYGTGPRGPVNPFPETESGTVIPGNERREDRGVDDYL